MAFWFALIQPQVTLAKDWLALIAAVFGLLGVIYVWTRSIAKWNGLDDAFTKALNGLGERVAKVESALTALDARADAIEREQARSSDDRSRIHERLGRAEQMSDACSDSMGQIQADIAGKVNDMRLYGDREFSRLRERLASLEKEIDIRLRGNGMTPR